MLKIIIRAVFIILILAAVLTLLFGCGNKVNATEKGISIARSAIKIADDYLDNNISGDEAGKKLDELIEKMKYVDNMPTGTADEESQYLADFFIQSDLLILSHNIMFDKYGDNKYDKIIEVRNDLAASIGEKQR